MTVFLPIVPNWRNGVRDTYEFKTDVFTARDGSEQRRALRENPRRTMEAALLLDGDRLRVFSDALNTAKDGKVEVSDFSADRATTLETVGDGATVFTVDRVPSWLGNGMTCCLVTGRKSRKVQIDFVTETNVVLTAGVSGAVGSGAHFLPFVPASVGNSATLSLHTTQVATSSIKFEIAPGTVVRVADALPFDSSSAGDSVQSFGPAAMLFGRYVLLRKPNYLNQPQMQFSFKFETVDYDRGVVKTFTPVPIISRTLTATYLAMSYADAMALLDIFIRCKGRAGEIYVPTWGSDFPPIVSASGNVIVVSGTDFYDTYHDDKAHAAILIRTTSGALKAFEITAMAKSGGNTTVQVHASHGLTKSTIDIVSWMFVSRFAQDALTVEWVTNQIANISLSFTTLENLAAESGYGSNWILATGYWRDRGEWIDSATWED